MGFPLKEPHGRANYAAGTGSDRRCNSAEDLKGALITIDPEVKTIVFDMAAMDYISSAGLRVLMAAHKAQTAKQGTVMLAHPQEAVVDILAATGFDTIFIIQP